MTKYYPPVPPVALTAQDVIAGVPTVAKPEAANVPWWLTGGISSTDCVAAYQPKGAADYAASKVNLANPGTYNATEGVEPDWSAANGWMGDGIDDYLDTGISTGASTWTMLIRFSNLTLANTYICGFKQTTGYYGFQSNGVPRTTFYNANSAFIDEATTGGVLAIANTDGYKNGADVVNLTGTKTATTNCFIFKMGDLANYTAMYVQAFAIYNTTLTPTQVGLLSTAMAAL